MTGALSSGIVGGVGGVVVVGVGPRVLDPPDLVEVLDQRVVRHVVHWQTVACSLLCTVDCSGWLI